MLPIIGRSFIFIETEEELTLQKLNKANASVEWLLKWWFLNCANYEKLELPDFVLYDLIGIY